MNHVKGNSDRSQLQLTSKDEASTETEDSNIKSSSSKKLLGVLLYNKLTFNELVSKLCKEAGKKLHALAQISKYMTKGKLRTIMKAFFSSQFIYCPLVWMFHNGTLNNRINTLEERALCLIQNDKTSFFYKLLQKDNSFKHPKIMCELFNETNVPYNLHQDVSFRSYNVETVLHGREMLSYLGPKTWDLVPFDIRDWVAEKMFCQKIEKRKPDRCICRLWKMYIPNLKFISYKWRYVDHTCVWRCHLSIDL